MNEYKPSWSWTPEIIRRRIEKQKRALENVEKTKTYFFRNNIEFWEKRLIDAERRLKNNGVLEKDEK